MSQNRVIIICVFASVIGHIAFFTISNFITVSGMQAIKDETRAIFKLKRVDKEPIEIRRVFGLVEREKIPSIKMAIPASEIKKTMLKDMSKEEISYAESASKKERIKEIDKDIELYPVKKTPKEIEQDMIKVEAEAVREDIKVKRRPLTDKARGVSFTSAPVTGEAEIADIRPREKESFLSPEQILPAFPLAMGADVAYPEETLKENPGRYKPLDKFLNVDLYTYIDSETKEKYFKISIKAARAAGTLEVMPKELIFLIDSSKSITEKKLSYLKKGLIDCIRKLNHSDLFNIIAFSEGSRKFKQNSVSVNAETFNEAIIFINSLHATGQTDVNRALFEIVSSPATVLPSYIILMTDGRPTAGIINSQKIMREITRKNDLIRPVFCFGGGARVNRYLLDFISYQNRAWCMFTDSLYDMQRGLVHFYEQMKDPLLLNLRYKFSNLSQEEVFPKTLPDFYRGSEFILFGRYEDEKGTFSMQLLGDINSQVKELIFKKSFSKAQRGNREIARGWAFRKIYHLISDITMEKGDASKLRQEIESLGKKYNIKTPYDTEE